MARGLEWNGDDGLYISNQSGTRIDEWGLTGEYRRSIALSDLGIPAQFSFGFVAPDLAFVFPTAEPHAEGYALSTGADWRLLRTLSMSAAPDVRMPATAGAGTGANVTGGKIVCGSVFDHEFRVFGLDGRLERVVQRPDIGFLPVGIDLERRIVASNGWTSPPLLVNGKYWLASSRWPTNMSDPLAGVRESADGSKIRAEWRHVLDLFDDRGRWLTGLMWDHPDRPGWGDLQKIGPDSRLYTAVRDPFPQVRRYRITIRPPTVN
ncbi:MAG: hypothetical protein GKS06_08045 [Acidobacteria bacterium]|nr:hypothetical protein [Acidobacteriota bacterium]